MKNIIVLITMLFIGLGAKAQEFYMVADKMPSFPGGYEVLLKYIEDHLNYPPKALAHKAQGEVNIRFLVTDKGELQYIAAPSVKKLGYDLEDSAISLIKAMPLWIPGKQNGKKVNVWINQPIKYKLPKGTIYFPLADLDFLPKCPGFNKYLEDSATTINMDHEIPVLVDIKVNTSGKVVEAMINKNDSSNKVLHLKALDIALNMPTWQIGLVDTIPVYYKLTKAIQFRFYNASLEEEAPLLEKNEKIWMITEEVAEFPGGQAALGKFISKNINYPQLAIENNVSGRVFIQFIVETDGSISEVKLARPNNKIGFGLEEEAIRVVKLLPKWKPARQGNKTVRMRYNLPINFQLK